MPSDPLPRWSDTRRMILPAAYRALRQWPKLTATVAVSLTGLLAAAWTLANTGQPEWGGTLFAVALLLGLFAAAGIIIAATISLARSTVEDILPISDPPTAFRAVAIMALATTPLAWLSSEMHVTGLAMAESIMLALFAATAAAAFLRPRGSIQTIEEPQ